MDDLIAEFLTETNESLEELESDLVTFEQNPQDTELLSKIFRIMHTIKGTCGFLGLPRLEKIAHAAENLMSVYREGELPVTSAGVSAIFSALDKVREILIHIENKGEEPEGEDGDLISHLDALQSGEETDGAEEVISPRASSAPSAVSENNPDNHDDSDHDAPPAEAAETSSALAAQSLRVNVDVLENLMTMVSELVLIRNQLVQVHRAHMREEAGKAFNGPMQRISQIVSDLQDGVMKTRMQPIGAAWSKLPRIVRGLAQDLSKKVDLIMTGQDTEIDRQVLDMIRDPLTHMVRNSVDHGIEKPEDRREAGKSETGTVRLSASHEGGYVLIRISDDGKGLNTARIREKAIEKKLVSEAEGENLSDQAILQYIFAPGFSTAEQVTAVSGRGVGMDVVRSNIEKIGGTVELDSESGRGSTFTIKIPLTLAIVPAVIIEVADTRFAVPQLNVDELVMVSDNSENQIEQLNTTFVYRLRGRVIPLVDLTETLHMGSANDNAEDSADGPPVSNRSKGRYIIVTEAAGMPYGILADRVFDTEEIVVKPVAQALKSASVYSGNTILGDGSVIMILDPASLAQEADISSQKEALKDLQAAGETISSGAVGDLRSYLVFEDGAEMPKAIETTDLSRLERIAKKDIEFTQDGQMLTPYRGKIMPILSFGSHISHFGSEEDAKGENAITVFVFEQGEHSLGFMAKSVRDIVESAAVIDRTSAYGTIAGHILVNEETIEIVDISRLLEQSAQQFTAQEMAAE